jgi:Caspase domain
LRGLGGRDIAADHYFLERKMLLYGIAMDLLMSIQLRFPAVPIAPRKLLFCYAKFILLVALAFFALRTVPPAEAQSPARGLIGTAAVTLKWNTPDDLDLRVTCPNGDAIYNMQRSKCDGILDIDSRTGPNAVEHIRWPGTAASGVYQIEVLLYQKSPRLLGSALTIDFTVEIRADGELQRVFNQHFDPAQDQGSVWKGTFILPAPVAIHSAIATSSVTPSTQTAISSPSRSVGRRVALVVGNSAYRYMPSLPNPKNDAKDIDSSLRGLGFETVLAVDLDRAAMNNAIDRFSRLVPGASLAIIYYSGHGMQFEGKNYLLPVDASLDSPADVNRYRLIPVDDLIDLLRSAAGLQLIVLDACRNNPIERDFKNRIASLPGGNRDAGSTRGFSRIEARNGLIITYATASDSVAADGKGANSPFTQAFLKNITTPDTDLRLILFQVQNDVFIASGATQLPEISSLYVGPAVILRTTPK